MSTEKNKRTEIVFIYDVKMNNPNGDPLDGNRPRIDDETGKCIVTDVRLKRTIRDYLITIGYNGMPDLSGKNKGDVFIKEVIQDGFVKDVKTRSKDFLIENEADLDNNKIIRNYLDGKLKDIMKHKDILLSNMTKNILEQCIDIRLFGATLAQELEKDKKGNSITFTGPVQFGMGKSLNKVKEKILSHSFVMASGEEKTAGSLADESVIQYGLIGFHGVINENAGIFTNLSVNDINILYDAMWNGTKNLLSKSKKGHMPRLLLEVKYSEPYFFIGDLLEQLEVKCEEKSFEEVEDISDVVIKTQKLNEVLKNFKDKIESITIVNKDDRLRLSEEITTLNKK